MRKGKAGITGRVAGAVGATMGGATVGRTDSPCVTGDTGGGGTAVVMIGNAIQFHCMEGGLPNTSNLPQQPVRERTISRLLTAIFRIAVLSVLLGGVTYLLTRMLPYSRVVVHNQPTGTTVKITSAKLTKPGFIVVFMQEEGGWKAVGSSWYLRPGYYRDIVVDIGYRSTIESLHKDNTTGNFEPRNFVVRLYEYRGTTYAFDENVDTPVTNRQGKIYQKRFWFEKIGHPVRHFFIRLRDEPLTFLWDVVWP